MIEEAVVAGARRARACAVLGLDPRTEQRWRLGEHDDDQRHGPSTRPHNKLRRSIVNRLVNIANLERFRNLPPKQIVPILADEGTYLASESTLYRELRRRKLLEHRRPFAPPTNHRPKELVASKPNKVWTWDITYLPAAVRGQFYYLYMVQDLYSRKIVAWSVEPEESAERASLLIGATCEQLGVKKGLWVHSDNGPAMKGATLLATLQRLGVMSSYSRPHVSNDNPFAESLFSVMKHRPWYPKRPFESIEEARAWVAEFVRWHNHDHRHSALKFVTPEQRYTGEDAAILARRARVYEQARRKRPEGWSGPTRDWTPPKVPVLNPRRTNT